MDFSNLYQQAKKSVKPKELSAHASSGGVGAAILTNSGKVYTGVCIDTACSMGFCAEHSAAAAMVTAGENIIKKMIAVGSTGEVIPPCGRCREFISQLAVENMNTKVMVAEGTVIKLKELLPLDWKSIKK